MGALRGTVTFYCIKSTVFLIQDHPSFQPYLTTNDAEKPPPIIPGVERSRPPGYPPELTALLTSAPSRRTKSLKPSHILNPPALPLRADPDSTEAKLLGPFSKRREVNIRKRYFGIETRKILPPIETSVRYLDASGDVQEDNSVKQISKLGLQAGGFQGTKLLDNLRDMSGFAIRSRSLTRRERKQLMGQINLDPEQNEDLKPGTKLALPTRFLRRRHQSLLGRLPILARVFRDAGENSDTTAKTPVKFDVVMDKGAIHHTLRHGSARLVDTDDINMAWLIRAQEEDKQIMKKGREKE